MAEALRWNHYSFGSFVSRYRRFLPHSKERGTAYLYKRSEAEKILYFARRHQFTHPLPRDPRQASEFKAKAIYLAERSAQKAVMRLMKVNGWDKLREA